MTTTEKTAAVALCKAVRGYFTQPSIPGVTGIPRPITSELAALERAINAARLCMGQPRAFSAPDEEPGHYEAACAAVAAIYDAETAPGLVTPDLEAAANRNAALAAAAKLPDADATPDRNDVLTAMENYGGSFVKLLAAAARRADSGNLARLINAWPEYWAEYTALAKSLAKDNDDDEPHTIIGQGDTARHLRT